MGEISIEGNVPSLIVTKQLLIDLFKTINKQNPRTIAVETSITIEGEKETKSWDNLRDFNSARYIPRKIRSLAVSKKPKNNADKHRLLNFYLIIDTQKPAESFYEVSGFNEGKVEVARKEIESLLDEHRTWYWFLYKGAKSGEDDSTGIYAWVFLAAAVSLSVLTYRILNIVRGIELAEANQSIAAVAFIAFLMLLGRAANRFFPYLDLTIRRKKRSVFWDFFMRALTFGLLANLLWELIRYALRKI